MFVNAVLEAAARSLYISNFACDSWIFFTRFAALKVLSPAEGRVFGGPHENHLDPRLSLDSTRLPITKLTLKIQFSLLTAGTAGKPMRNLLGTSRGIAKKRVPSLRNDFGWSNGVPLGSMSIAFWQLEYCFHPCAQYWKIAFLRLEIHFYCDCAVVISHEWS